MRGHTEGEGEKEEGGGQGQEDWWKDEGRRVRGRRREEREMYCSEERCEDNDVGASGSIKEQREEDKREVRKVAAVLPAYYLLEPLKRAKNYALRQ